MKNNDAFFLTLLALGVIGIVAILALKDKQQPLSGLENNLITKNELDNAIRKALEAQNRTALKKDPEGSDTF